MENCDGKILKTGYERRMCCYSFTYNYTRPFYRISAKRSALYFLFNDKIYLNILMLVGLKKAKSMDRFVTG